MIGWATGDVRVQEDLLRGLELLRAAHRQNGKADYAPSLEAEVELRELADEARARTRRVLDELGSLGHPTSEPKRTLRAVEVASILGIDRRNVIALAHRGTLPGRQVNRVWQFDPVDVEAYRQERSAS